MADDKTLAKQVEKLAARLDKIEAALDRGYQGKPTEGDDGVPRFCAVPAVPERVFATDVSPDRARLIRYLDKKWVNGTTLHYYYFKSGAWGGPATQRDIVTQGFEMWRQVGIGINFEPVDNIADAEIRIGFLQGDGAWSYVGRDVIDIPGQQERTMNFGWDLTQDSRGVDVPVHEIGHTLGFPHEHQNPFAGIVWDEEAVYRYFGGPPNNWPRNQTEFNVLRKLPAAEVEGSEWDPDSVMHYGFPAGLILEPAQYRTGLRPHGGLSPHDIEEVRRFYPQITNTNYPKLTPLQSTPLSIAAGEQRNFLIEPTESREYTVGTFGKSDTVMVLFEEQQNGDLKFVAGDDDSGTSLNARIVEWLDAGKRYVLRIRLYLNWASADTAVMLW